MRNKPIHKIYIFTVLTLCQAAFLFLAFNTKLIFAQYDEIGKWPLAASEASGKDENQDVPTSTNENQIDFDAVQSVQLDAIGKEPIIGQNKEGEETANPYIDIKIIKIKIIKPDNNEVITGPLNLSASSFGPINKLDFYMRTAAGPILIAHGRWDGNFWAPIHKIDSTKYLNGKKEIFAKGLDTRGKEVKSDIVVIYIDNAAADNPEINTEEAPVSDTGADDDKAASETINDGQDQPAGDNNLNQQNNGKRLILDNLKKGDAAPKNNKIDEECRQNNILNPARCKEFLYKKTAPAECVKAHILNDRDCQKYLFEKNIPLQCLKANITSSEICKKYLFEKESLTNNAQLLTDCRDKGIKNKPTCDKFLKKKYLPDECKYKNINNTEKCQTYLKQKTLSKECLNQDIKTREECNGFLLKKYAFKKCADNGITEENCGDFIFEKYKNNIICKNLDKENCATSIKQRHLANIAATQNKFKKLKEIIRPIASQTIAADKLEEKLGEDADLLPIKNKRAIFKILKSKDKLILDENDNLIQTPPVVLTLDNDEDGLPDNLEKRIGTNPNSADSDNDGYSDLEELKNNFNPLGPGKLKRKLSPVEEAIINEQILEQPKTEGEISNGLTVNNVSSEESIQTDGEAGYVLNGQAQPNTVISLYIYSELPLIATVETDEYGNWQYHLNQPLVDGEHEVYVALNDNTGKIINKSRPFWLFIKEAKAVSIDDFIPSSAPQTKSEEDKLINFYLIISLIIISLGIIVFVILLAIHNKNRRS